MNQVRRPRSFSPPRGSSPSAWWLSSSEAARSPCSARPCAHAWATVQAPGPTRPADALLLCVAAAGTLLVAWLALSLTLSLLAALPGAAGAVAARGAATLAPAAVRRLAAALLGRQPGRDPSAGTAMATWRRRPPPRARQ